MKTVLITGASRGIGKAIGIAMAKEEKYNLVLNCKSNEVELNKTYEEVSKYCRSMKILADVSDYNETKVMFEKIENEFGKVDILINNAGISKIELFNKMEMDDIKNTIDTNLYSVINCSRLAIDGMVEKKSGSIINITSVWGEVGASMEVIYSTSKAGIIGFTKALAREVGPSNIRVNGISLGYFNTDMNRSIDKDDEMNIIDEIPLCRLGNPEEIGDLCNFLVSDKNSYMTGQILRVDGGWI